MIVHYTAGGCPLRTVDLISTGTISGQLQEDAASLLELSHGGTLAIRLTAIDQEGQVNAPRWAFLEDGTR